MRCFINIPVLGRTEENVEHSVMQMLAIAQAKWGEDIEVAIAADDDKKFLVNAEPDYNYLMENLKVLESCDCAIIVFDTHFCKDSCIINLINQTIQMKGLTVVVLHCLDWFPDSTQEMNNVPIC